MKSLCWIDKRQSTGVENLIPVEPLKPTKTKIAFVVHSNKTLFVDILLGRYSQSGLMHQDDTIGRIKLTYS